MTVIADGGGRGRAGGDSGASLRVCLRKEKKRKELAFMFYILIVSVFFFLVSVLL